MRRQWPLNHISICYSAQSVAQTGATEIRPEHSRCVLTFLSPKCRLKASKRTSERVTITCTEKGRGGEDWGPLRRSSEQLDWKESEAEWDSLDFDFSHSAAGASSTLMPHISEIRRLFLHSREAFLWQKFYCIPAEYRKTTWVFTVSRKLYKTRAITVSEVPLRKLLDTNSLTNNLSDTQTE